MCLSTFRIQRTDIIISIPGKWDEANYISLTPLCPFPSPLPNNLTSSFALGKYRMFAKKTFTKTIS